ncbi:MAG: prepilin-type N-terminal cleavage/methylation domain-containing protein [Gammaproteobacteria bacterium]|nr:prepilin-type N-terminal cleavage/methylation domain-containing protein [Gammaproteobacteria bacterium]
MFFNLNERSYKLNHQVGFSLLELSIVVLILGIMAIVVIPDPAPSDQHKLDLAAQLTADAMRFARSEAMRLGEPVGFSQQNNEKRIRVYRLDTNTVPWTTIFDVYHPVSKKPYDSVLANHALTRGITVTANRDFRGVCNAVTNVYFDGSGIARCADPETVLVNRYDVTLTLGSNSRTVSLTGVSGQVSIQ